MSGDSGVMATKSLTESDLSKEKDKDKDKYKDRDKVNVNVNVKAKEKMSVTEDVIEAASVLDRLKTQADGTILDKVISHPIISNSISYVLEKTINTANTNIIPHEREEDEEDAEAQRIRKRVKLDHKILPPPKAISRQMFTRKTPNLRQQVAISSAFANTQRSLQDIKDLSTLNINIESRKKLTMLIQFLKLGNNQLSERIEKLIDTVDKQRSKLGSGSGSGLGLTSASASNNSKPNDINDIKSDIVATVKKIVNVVSKVPAQSLSEPARKKIRDALLKLPTNWSNNELHFLTGDDLGDFSSSSSSSESEADEDSESNSDYEDSRETPLEGEQIPTIRVTNKRLFQKVRRPSITRRLLNSLLEYRQTKKGKSRVKMKRWFKEKIKDQILNDSNGKVLILAQESLDMISKIIKTCNESLDKAETWNIGKQLIHQVELSNKLKDIDYPQTTSVKNSSINRQSTPEAEVITVKDDVDNHNNNSDNNNNNTDIDINNNK